jgi:hypothetical protein
VQDRGGSLDVKRRRIAVTLLIAAVALRCVTELPLPTVDEARAVIEASPWFHEPKTVRLATGDLPTGAMTVEDLQADQVYRVMKDLDLIDIRPGPKGTTTVTLTERGLEASRSWEWQKTVEGDGKRTWESWQVAVASKKIVQMLEPASGIPGTAVVEFVWRWEPNPLGEKLVMQNEPVRTSTSFKRDERGWRIVS